MVSRVYENLSPKEKKYVHLFPAENIIPFNSSQIRQADSETIDSGLRDCLKEVYAIRYFTRYQ
jgi:hypothetical protein